MTESIVVKGIPELQRALFKYNDKLAVQLNRVALRQGANYLKNQIKANTPVAKKAGKNTIPGLAKKTIKVYNSKKHGARKDGIIGLWVGWRGGNGGRVKKNKKGKRDAYYIGWVERGYNRNSKKAGVVLSRTAGLIQQGSRKAGKVIGLKTRRQSGSGRFIARFGGTRVEGQHFAQQAFNASASHAVDIIINSSNRIMIKVAKDLNFKTESR